MVIGLGCFLNLETDMMAIFCNVYVGLGCFINLEIDMTANFCNVYVGLTYIMDSD
ncbi:hypothetical protein HanPI659440_Chr13g0494821 [Helianthus annuus]|nr:hypothetical protein HanPI659440_Chr13g0494821 [Helianthus annuus]